MKSYSFLPPLLVRYIYTTYSPNTLAKLNTLFEGNYTLLFSKIKLNTTLIIQYVCHEVSVLQSSVKLINFT